MRGAVWAAVALLLAVQSSNSRAQSSQPIDRRVEAVLAKWQCPIAGYIEKIHRSPAEKHRFLVLVTAERPELYVQCMLYDKDARIRCEAASGYYFEKIKGFASERRLAALTRLGFSTDATHGNFSLDKPFTGADASAKLFLETMARVFDLKVRDRLRYSAPMLSNQKENVVRRGRARAAISML